MASNDNDWRTPMGLMAIQGAALFQTHRVTGYTLAILGLLTTAWVYGGTALDCRGGSSRGCGRDAVLVPWNYSSGNLSSEDLGQDAEKTYVRHEWTGFVLLEQAFVFLFSPWLWRRWNEMNGIVEAFSSTTKMNNFRRGSVLLVGEVLCCVNVIFQSVSINNFFDSAFTRHSFEVFGWTYTSAHHRTDPFIRAYPRRLRCSYADQRSPSGQRYEDDFCWLNLSPFVEKIYMVSWFWFVLLAVFSCLSLLSHCVLLYVSCRVACQIVEKDRKLTDKSESVGPALA